MPEPEIGGVVLPGKSLGLSSEMEGNAEHEEVGAVVCRDVATVKGELGEVVFVFNKWRDRIGHVIADAGQNIETRSKGGFRAEPSAGDIANIESDTETSIRFHLVLITSHSNQCIKS